MKGYTIAQAKKEIKASIAVYLKKDEAGNYRMREVNRLPFYLQGPPGVGKTEAARQIAEELGIGFVSLSITHHTRNTVLGLPVIREIAGDAGTRYTEYTMSEMIALVEKKVEEGYAEGILLVDEFSCMADSLVAPMLAFLQTKNIGTHHLPEGWVMILCSNPDKYNRSARSFDMAVMDRVRYMEIVADADEFINYGERTNLHSAILGYLRLYPGDAHSCEASETGERTIVTARGWENLSWCLKGYEEAGDSVTWELIRQFIKSEEISGRFFRYYLSGRSGMCPEEIGEILDGKNLTRYIDRMRGKKYEERFRVMRLIGSVLDEQGNELGERENLCVYLGKVKDFFVKALEQKCSLADMMEARANGDSFPFSAGCDLDRELDEAECRAWQEIRTNYLGKLGYSGTGFSGESRAAWERCKACLAEAVEEYQECERKELQQAYWEVSRRIARACEFLEAIGDEGDLEEPFINLLNRNEGILDAMTAVKTPVYLECSRRNYG